ncbi:peptide-methionine (S)-S-oxide reductase MsrA [Edaphobacter modestus]|uniref:Peptide methionine sulfoxide reductase MsrA n=1 Tax=Edaphobacter modestus TaxID=388466 RepID=A0A4Q7YWP4_9BACT|nr:peptide-methionine (S)-S-oxide reductase MsrA [Edaphobacter modestus]RZU41814.1 peptide-methionine (S)-S-oxide reductase [Edaphobacter modestus]
MRNGATWLRLGLAFIALLAVVLVMGGRKMAGVAEAGRGPIPAPQVDEPVQGSRSETAVFAGGCFWGVQTVFQRVKGVTATTAGYSGGTKESANYRDVSSERTDHAEAVKIVFDPSKVSYGTLLRIFFSVVHDPTQLNRQGPDVGTSYRSAIFFTTPEQQKVAAAYIVQLDAAHVFPKKIVTQLVPLAAFYDGEDYHQDYAEKNPDNPYIQVCDVPKIAGLKQQFPELFQDYKHK